ncbi:hypothetical protein [Eubacterium ruminantium]|uniref:hypothetical protein n=1 Tax=Eubacterium ruminantium TaxID=42322 RepID=UPI00115FB011|nr:hypothetical protein [Eubacterium ruminantium]
MHSYPRIPFSWYTAPTATVLDALCASRTEHAYIPFVSSWKYYDPDEDPDGPELKQIPKHVRVYETSDRISMMHLSGQRSLEIKII